MRRKQNDAIAQTRSFANVMRDEHDRLFARRPDFLNVSVQLLARQCIKGALFPGRCNNLQLCNSMQIAQNP
jgi:hypothetical protein